MKSHSILTYAFSLSLVCLQGCAVDNDANPSDDPTGQTDQAYSSDALRCEALGQRQTDLGGQLTVRVSGSLSSYTSWVAFSMSGATFARDGIFNTDLQSSTTNLHAASVLLSSTNGFRLTVSGPEAPALRPDRVVRNAVGSIPLKDGTALRATFACTIRSR